MRIAVFLVLLLAACATGDGCTPLTFPYCKSVATSTVKTTP